MNKEQQKHELILIVKKAINANTEQHFADDTVYIDGNDVDHIAEQVADEVYAAGYQKVLLDTENGKAVDSVQYAPSQLIEGYTEREVEKARKDTAKAILNVLYFNLQNSMKGNLANSNDYYNVMDRIQKIAENYGVEIEK